MDILNIITEAQAEKKADSLKWAVCYTIPAATQDDKKEKVETVAVFRYPYQADDFINKCLPEETKEKFFVISIHNNYNKEIREKYFN